MNTVIKTDLGRVRQHNEDAVTIVYNQDEIPLFVLADGMGGHQAGDVASSMTVNFFQEKFSQTKGRFSAKEAEAWLVSAIEELNEKIYTYSMQNQDCLGMGTTVVAVSLCQDQSLTVAHVGDSRAYLLGKDGLIQVTEDHSYVNELVKRGALSLEDAQTHPKRNILMRALGTEKTIQVDVQTISIDEKSCLLICTDGLSGKISINEMEDILHKPLSLEEKSKLLIECANEAGGEDNISVILVDLTNLQAEGEQ